MKFMLFICRLANIFRIVFCMKKFLHVISTKKYLAELEYKRQIGLAETWKTIQIINDDSCAPFCVFIFGCLLQKKASMCCMVDYKETQTSHLLIFFLINYANG